MSSNNKSQMKILKKRGQDIDPYSTLDLTFDWLDKELWINVNDSKLNW